MKKVIKYIPYCLVFIYGLCQNLVFDFIFKAKYECKDKCYYCVEEQLSGISIDLVILLFAYTIALCFSKNIKLLEKFIIIAILFIVIMVTLKLSNTTMGMCMC